MRPFSLLVPLLLLSLPGVETVTTIASPPGIQVYVQAVGTPAYSQATAHAPAFADRQLWPHLTGKEAFATQTWPKARLLVYSPEGKGWLEDGKPASTPPDENTDVLLPEAEKPYAVALGEAERKYQVYRHITIGRNVTFKAGGDGVGRKIAGNVWIKQGGSMYAQGATRFIGTGHSFFRNDNLDETYLDNWKRRQRNLVSQYFAFSRQGGSVEFFGYAAVLDEFGVDCPVVVGVDSKLLAGRNASPVIGKNGHLALLDGAVWGKWSNEIQNRDLHCDGRISGGLPDRPLTRSASLLLNFKNFGNAQYEGPDAESKKGQRLRYSPTPALILGPAAEVRSHGAGRLRLAWGGETPSGTRQMKGWGTEDAKCAARYAWFDAQPRAIDVWAAKGAVVRDVDFDHLRPGGLMLQEADMRSAWTGLGFGPSCQAQGEGLFAVVPDLKQYAATGK